MTETTTTSAPAWSPDIHFYAADVAVPEALVLRCATVAGEVEGDAVAVRVPYADDATATIVAEGDPIDEADPTLAETTIYTAKVAQLFPVSREQMAQPSASQLLMQSVRRAVTRRGNEMFIAQPAPASGTLTPPAGLVNIDGLTEQPEAIATSLDPLIDLIAELEGLDAAPTQVLLAPDAWARLRKIKTKTGSVESLLGAGTNDAERRLLDLEVLTSPAVPAGRGLVIDRSAVVAAVGQVSVATSADAYFGSDAIGVRATWRLGANVVRPERLGTFQVAQPGE